jgi:hypothetical protein
MTLLEANFQSNESFPKVGVIIATSFNRTELLFEKSLPSVIRQTRMPDIIVIVDDNKNIEEFNHIYKRVIEINKPNIFCIRNHRVKHHSGTGAWNSGVDFLCKIFDDPHQSYIAILDDDDEWEETYIEKCMFQIGKRGIKNTKAVFANLVRLHRNFDLKFNLYTNDLTIDNFLIGNPGVQSSNMFFNIRSILDIGGFDETLQSCTDRDLMIRLLENNDISNIALINEMLVYHHVQDNNSITSDKESKWNGLDRFYNKYLNRFTHDTLEMSLQRAEHYFSYPKRDKIVAKFHKIYR